MDTLRIQQWPVRRQILDKLIDILADGQPRRARELVDLLAKQGLKAPKKVVNSVLFSEGKRYVVYDRKTWFYSLRAEDGTSPSVETLETVDGTATDESCESSGLSARILWRGEGYVIQTGPGGGPAFFEVDARGATVFLSLNRDHPLYERFLVALAEAEEDEGDGQTESQEALRECLTMLLAAWSRFETDEPEGVRRQRAQDARADWGRAARDLLTERQNSEP